MKFLKLILKIVLLVILLGVITAGIDFYRLKNGEIPIFNISSMDDKTNIQTFRGLFYIGERKVRSSGVEPLIDSKNIKYRFLVFDIDILKQSNEDDSDMKIQIDAKGDCQNEIEKLYEDDHLEVYTNCLNGIKIQLNQVFDLKVYISKNPLIMNEIVNKLGYMGLYKDTNILVFDSREKDPIFNQGITIYQCDTEKDTYYIGKKGDFYQKGICEKNDELLK